MRRLTSAGAILWAAACTSSPSETSLAPLVSKDTFIPSPSASAVATSGAETTPIARVWQAAISGDAAGAREAFASLGVDAADPQTYFPGPVIPTADGSWLVARVRGGLLVADAAGKPQRFIPVTTADPTSSAGDRVDPIAGSVFVFWSSPKARVFDASTGEILADLDMLYRYATSKRRLVFHRADNDTLAVWDLATRSVWTFGPEVAAPGPSLSFLDDDGSLLRVENAEGALWDLDRRRQLIAYDWSPAWALSPDGKYIAFTEPAGEECGKGPEARTVLASRADGRVLASSTDCPNPSSLQFSANGGRLAVGDFFGNVYILDVPDLSHAVTVGTGPRRTCLDDSGDVASRVEFFRRDSLVAVTRSFSGLALFALPATGPATIKTPLWSGGGELFDMGARGLAVVEESDGHGRVLSLSSTGQEARERRLNDQELAGTQIIPEIAQRLRSNPWLLVKPHACKRGEWILPRSVCLPEPPE